MTRKRKFEDHEVRTFVMGSVLESFVGCLSTRDVIACAREKGLPVMGIRPAVEWLLSVSWLKREGQLLHPTDAAIHHKATWVEGMEELFTEPGPDVEPIEAWDGTKLNPSLIRVSLDPAKPSVLLSPGNGYTGEIELVGEAAADATSRILTNQARKFEAIAGGRNA